MESIRASMNQGTNTEDNETIRAIKSKESKEGLIGLASDAPKIC